MVVSVVYGDELLILCERRGRKTKTKRKETVGIMELPRQPSLSDRPEGTALAIANLVGALSLDVTALLALVANLLATSGLLGAVTGVVSGLAAVVALHAVDTLAWKYINKMTK